MGAVGIKNQKNINVILFVFIRAIRGKLTNQIVSATAFARRLMPSVIVSSGS